MMDDVVRVAAVSSRCPSLFLLFPPRALPSLALAMARPPICMQWDDKAAATKGCLYLGVQAAFEPSLGLLKASLKRLEGASQCALISQSLYRLAAARELLRHSAEPILSPDGY